MVYRAKYGPLLDMEAPVETPWFNIWDVMSRATQEVWAVTNGTFQWNRGVALLSGMD